MGMGQSGVWSYRPCQYTLESCSRLGIFEVQVDEMPISSAQASAAADDVAAAATAAGAAI